MSGPSLMAVLNELLGAEEELWIAYGEATVLYTQGALTPAYVQRYTALRDELYANETAIYDMLHTLAQPLGIADRIPAPTRLPDLNASPSAVAPAGLGAIPALVWVGVVIIVLAEIAAFAYIVTRVAEIGADLVARIYQIHRDSLNYELQLQAVAARFNACLRAGRIPADCAAATPIPTPPMRDLPSTSDYVFEIAALGGVVAGLGGLAWLAYQHKTS